MSTPDLFTCFLSKLPQNSSSPFTYFCIGVNSTTVVCRKYFVRRTEYRYRRIQSYIYRKFSLFFHIINVLRYETLFFTQFRQM